MTETLTEWADRRLLPALLVVLLVTDLLVGAVWVLTGPGQFSSPAYDAAEILGPMRCWGALLLVLASVSATALRLRGWTTLTGGLVYASLGGFWLGWTVMFGLGAIGRPGASLTGAVFAGSLAALHLLAGGAVTHRGNPTGR